MTRWKLEPTYTIIHMHAHNRWSNWYSALQYAAECLGLPVALRTYANHHDGSTDREWYVPADALARVGGFTAVQALAEANRRADLLASADADALYHSDAAW